MLSALQANPPWRTWFLTQLSLTPDGLPVADALLTALAATSSPPQAAEINPYLEALIASGGYQLAFLTWLHFLPPEQAKSVPFVYDGDFEQPLADYRSDWQISQARGADTRDRRQRRNPAIGKAVRVVFSVLASTTTSSTSCWCCRPAPTSSTASSRATA